MSATAGRRREYWGWSYEDEPPSGAELEQAAGARSHLGYPPLEVEEPAPFEPAALPAPRLRPPEALRAICSEDEHDRAVHAYGRSYRDLGRAFRARFDHPPDVVARPGGEEDLERLLEQAADAGAAVVLYGGGTSVVGGVEPDRGPGFAGTVSLDLAGLDGPLDLDVTSGGHASGRGRPGPPSSRHCARTG